VKEATKKFVSKKPLLQSFTVLIFFLITSGFKLFYILEIKEPLAFSLFKKKLKNHITFSSGSLIFSNFLKNSFGLG
jgi:hypothetical protein